ncbi:MAG TPA: type VI secretion system contractile sheath protein TssC, partial [Niabella sp.]|nr:type VI secretion system contractile sheath protein TssC [Niabella sp.]
MSEELQQQSQSDAMQAKEAVKIANPLEHLKTSSDKLAKFGGFDLIESSIDGAQNLNPDRKARRNIFLSESQKKGEREELLR